MNIFEDIKSSLNNTLEIALGIEKVNTMINPKKAHTEGKNLVNAVYKEIQFISNLSRNRLQNPSKIEKKEPPKPATTIRSTQPVRARNVNYKKNFSVSIKSINDRVQRSRAGKRMVGEVLQDENLSFSTSFNKALSSRSNTPKPTVLPFVSFRTGRTENSMRLPDFQEYLETKGSNYLKTKDSDEILTRLDRASARLSKFREEFDVKANSILKTIDDRNKRVSILRPFGQSIDIKTPVLKTSRVSSNQPFYRKKHPSKSVFIDTVQGFNIAKINENQKFLDILNKIDLERPLIIKQKVELIQNDKEKYKNRIHSVKKFENFRKTVEKSRRERQASSSKQGTAYMNIIEGFRLQRYKPSQAELEILDYWKQMVELGWLITKNDLQDKMSQILTKNSGNAKILIEKLSKVL